MPWKRTWVCASATLPWPETKGRESRCKAHFPRNPKELRGVSPCDAFAHFVTTMLFMAAIGRFQKGDDIFHAKVVDGELFKLHGDVFGSPSFDKKPTPIKGVKTLTPVAPSKIIAVGLNYADHARESGKPLPKDPLFWLK